MSGFILFMRGVGGWLAKHPATIFMALTTLAFAVVLIGKNSDIARLQKDIATVQKSKDDLNVSYGVCRANSATLSASLDVQNKAVDDMAAAAKLRDDEFKKNLTRITQERLATNKTVVDLLKRTAPADKCKGAYDLVQELAQ